MKKVIFLFIDGLGIGKSDSTNPFYELKTRFFSFNGLDISLGPVKINDTIVYPIDAGLSVQGIPQSATGQTSLFTGVNGAKLIGGHLFGFPSQKLRKLIIKRNLLKEIKSRGKKAVFFNSYINYASLLNQGEVTINKNGIIQIKENNTLSNRLRRFMSVTTVQGIGAGIHFFSISDLKKKHSLYHDFTNSILRDKGFQVRYLEPFNAGRILAKESKKYDFILYEYFLSDTAGHSGNIKRIKRVIMELDSFVYGILNSLEDDTILLITSDHGNIEDISVRSHTRNPVPLILFNAKEDILKNNKPPLKLTDIFDFVLNIIEN